MFGRIVYIAIFTMLAGLLAGCGGETGSGAASEKNEAATSQQVFKWKLVTSWPKNFPGLGVGPERFATLVDQMSAGRLKVTVYGANQFVPAFEVFDAVSEGTAEMGHSAAYYWKGKSPAAQFFTSIPFGLTAQEMNGWLHYGGGMELWRDVYKPFGVLPFAGGNTGVQMGGWFNKEINSVSDLKGLKMRLPGLGGEVLKRLGGLPVTLAGGELFTSLQSGAIDATEWVGPYNDLAFGLHEAAKYYYYPGWHEPGSTLEFIVNQQAYNSLPEDLQAIVNVATRMVNADMLDEYTFRNIEALRSLRQQHDVDVRSFPQDVLAELKRVSAEVIAEQSKADPVMQKVLNSFRQFESGVRDYHEISERAYSEAVYSDNP